MYGLRTVVNRCGVLAGPWQMGKVDQGFIVLWMARHLYGGALAYTGFGGEGLQVRDILHVDDLYDLLRCNCAQLDRHSGATYNVAGGIERSVSLRELTEWCQRLDRQVPADRAGGRDATSRRSLLRRRQPIGADGDRLAATTQARSIARRRPSLARRAARPAGADSGDLNERCHHHRRRRTDRSRGGPVLQSEGPGRRRYRQRHARRLLRTGRQHALVLAAAPARCAVLHPCRGRYPRCRCDRAHLRPLRRKYLDRHSRRRATFARLGGARADDRFHRQRQRHVDPARGGAQALPGLGVHLLQHQQGLWRHAQSVAVGRGRNPLGAGRHRIRSRRTASTNP